MVLLECRQNSRVKMFRLSAAIAVGNDVHGLLMVECQFISWHSRMISVNDTGSRDSGTFLDSTFARSRISSISFNTCHPALSIWAMLSC